MSRRLSRSFSLRDLFRPRRRKTLTRSVSSTDLPRKPEPSFLPWDEYDDAVLAAKRQCTSEDLRDACDIYARAFCKKHRASPKTEDELKHFLRYAQEHRYLLLDSTVGDLRTMCDTFLDEQ